MFSTLDQHLQASWTCLFVFIAAFTGLLDYLQLSGSQSIICGDYNCPGSDGEVLDDRFDDVLLMYNLKQHVQVSTPELGQVLDLIITRDDVIDLISNVTVSSQCISDHSLVACTIKIRRKNQVKHTYCYRNIKNIELDHWTHSSLTFVCLDYMTHRCPHCRQMITPMSLTMKFGVFSMKLRRFELQSNVRQ